jgi:hypothetical protein
MRTTTLAIAATVLLVVMPNLSGAAAGALWLKPATLPAIGKVDERFQSYNIEMAQVIGAKFWKPYARVRDLGVPMAAAGVGLDPNLFEARPPVDLSDPRLLVLAAALGPAYVRVSGTWANTVRFQDSDDPPPAIPPAGFRGVLTRAQWKGVVDFAKAADAKLVTSFAIDSAVRDSSGVWTPVEAQRVIAYTHASGGAIYAAELFNEPDLPSIGGAPPGYDAQAFARDEAAFVAFAKHVAPEMKIAGPGDTGSSAAAAETLMAAEPRPRVDIFSYHFYPALSQRCAPTASPAGATPDEALSESWLARTDKAFQAHNAVRDRYAPNTPIWLTETAGAACGGTPWDATFLDTFRYLDQMGRLAKQGVSAIFHNTLSAGEYGLIDERTLKPLPNYWAALLWHRMMGTTVLDAGAIKPGLHVYAHCLRDHPGGVSVLAINLQRVAADIDVSAPAEVYGLTASSLQSETVLLNGKPLAVGPGNTPPSLQPKHSSEHVTLAPTSIAFIAVSDAGNTACQ